MIEIAKETLARVRAALRLGEVVPDYLPPYDPSQDLLTDEQLHLLAEDESVLFDPRIVAEQDRKRARGEGYPSYMTVQGMIETGGILDNPAVYADAAVLRLDEVLDAREGEVEVLYRYRPHSEHRGELVRHSLMADTTNDAQRNGIRVYRDSLAELLQREKLEPVRFRPQIARVINSLFGAH